MYTIVTTARRAICTRAIKHANISLGVKQLVARNAKQQEYMRVLEDSEKCIVIGHGAAGSGKTKLAIEVGLRKLRSGSVSKMVITRPAIAVDDEAHGFLPGTLWDKYKVWMMPVMDCTQDKGFGASEYVESMIRNSTLEIAPLAFMRGRTFENAWILCDEAQNLTDAQLLMILTRIGTGSKLVLAGDPKQNDRSEHVDSALTRFANLVRTDAFKHPQIEQVEFDENDVERHPIIPHILKMYGSMTVIRV